MSSEGAGTGGMKVVGGCLCGAVRYEVSGPFLRAGHCHCSRCQKHSGTSHLTQGRVRREDFRLLAGADRLGSWKPESGGAVKVFCRRCGSSLFGGDWPDGPEVSIRLGSVDGDPGLRPQSRTFVGSRAVWDRIADDLQQFEGALPANWQAGQPPDRVGLVRRYYDELWNAWRFDLIPELLDPSLRFRGSLGTHVEGHDGFRTYMDAVRAAFPDFHNQVDEVVGVGDRVVARLTWTGTQRGPVLGLAASGRAVRYQGMAWFEMPAGRIVRAHVFGDVDGLRAQITPAE